jgi:hypothetical protein
MSNQLQTTRRNPTTAGHPPTAKQIASSERLMRVAKAIWEYYPRPLPAWDDLPEYTPDLRADRPLSRGDFRDMARAALEAEGIIIDD